MRRRIRFATEPLAGRAEAGEGAAPRRLRGELVTTLEGGALTVVGLTPFGTRAFVARQRGAVVRLEAGIARSMGIEPYHLLDALNRALWQPEPDAPGDEARVVHEGEAIEVQSAACGYRTRLLVVDQEPLQTALPGG